MRKSLFALVLVVGTVACGSASGRPVRSGIAGRLVAGPTCPVERMPPDPRCAPRPVVASVRIRRVGAAGSARVVRSGSDGRFRIGLAPGRYVLTALAVNHSAFPRPPQPVTVTVRARHYTVVTLTYDTGIR